MISLEAGSWKTALDRIESRHVEVYVVVRLYEGGKEPAGVVLWHTPLRGLRLTDDTCVEIKAGDPASPIVYTTQTIQSVSAEFSDDGEHVRRLEFNTDAGDRIVMELDT